MAKAALLLPNIEIMESVSYAANLYHLSVCSTAIVDHTNIRHYISQALADGADFIIARGSQAELIQSLVSVPVVEIKITSLEIGAMLKSAKDLTGMDCPAVALTGPKNMFAYIDTDSFNRLFGIRLQVYLFQTVEEMVATAKKAIAQKADVVIGGSIVCEYCRSVSVPCLKTVSGRESALEACRIASQLSTALDTEKQNAASLKMLLDYAYSGIIHIDEHGRILRVNRFVETLVMMEAASMEHMPVWRIIPGITKKMLDFVLEKQKKIHSAAILINQSEFLISISPVLVEGAATGAIISFYEGRPVAAGNEEMKRELMSQGHVAKMKFGSLIARSPAMQAAVERARGFADFQFPILITGEGGTEKLPLAECIHNEGAFQDCPFIRFQCEDCDHSQMEALLFGKPENGSFPGLVYQGPCTLYLYEIGQLPAAASPGDPECPLPLRFSLPSGHSQPDPDHRLHPAQSSGSGGTGHLSPGTVLCPVRHDSDRTALKRAAGRHHRLDRSVHERIPGILRPIHKTDRRRQKTSSVLPVAGKSYGASDGVQPDPDPRLPLLCGRP